MSIETIEPTEIIKVEEIDVVELFTTDQVDGLLVKIQEAVAKHVPDVSTADGRGAIASLARKVSSAKMIVENMGKETVAEWKRKAAKIDAGRKRWRDTMDAIRDETRKPLSDWEAEQAAIAEATRLEAERDKAEEEAYAEEDLRERRRIIEEKEAELARQEAERKAREEAQRIERERKEREERIAKEAAEKARREAEQEAERKERERQERETREKAEAERKAANKRHRLAVQREAIKSLIDAGLDDPDAQRVIELIDAGAVTNVTINY